MKIQIENDQDLAVLGRILADLGLEYSVEDAETLETNVPMEAINGIHAGLDDLHKGRVIGHTEAKKRIAAKIDRLRVRYAG